MADHDGNISPGAEPKSHTTSELALALCANESSNCTTLKHQNQVKGQDQPESSGVHKASKDTTARNPPARKDQSLHRRGKTFSGTLSRPSSGPEVDRSSPARAADRAPQRTQAKKQEGTTALPAAATTTPSLPSSAPLTAVAVPAAHRPGASPPKKCSMLTISSALCNDNFTVRRDQLHPGASTHRPQKTTESSENRSKGSVAAGKARYQERFAPLRPTDRGQIEALQRRRREREKRRQGEEAPHHQASQQQAPPFSSSQEVARPQAPAVEPPSWAVPAPGEARLEPVCESLGVQESVDLTSRPCYRVGRSPASDVQLLHATSSRRHALIFHHPNGSCYVVDCGSAHGTYVNGVRVPSASDGAGPSGNAVVVPRRVRRGALVRFGGPGAPTFVLKSFSVGFENLVRDLPGVDADAEDSDSASSSEESMDELLSGFFSPGKPVTKPEDECKIAEGHCGLRRVVSKEGEDGVAMDYLPSPALPQKPSPAVATPVPTAADQAQSEASLVRLNTRLNALGGSSRLPTSSCRRMARRASAQLSRVVQPQKAQPPRQRQLACLFQKRPRELELQPEDRAKRARTEPVTSAAAPSQSESPLPELSLSPKPSSPPAIVSPVTTKLLLSPDIRRAPPPPMLLSLAASAPTPVQLRETLTLASSEAFACPKSLLIPSSGELKGQRCASGAAALEPKLSTAVARRRVRFSDEAPQTFYPASITPDEQLSADECDEFALAPTPPSTPRAMLAGF